jgi:hypothetical protein
MAQAREEQLGQVHSPFVIAPGYQTFKDFATGFCIQQKTVSSTVVIPAIVFHSNARPLKPT